MITKVMKERIERVGGTWKRERDGFYTLIGQSQFSGPVVYVGLPEGHPDIGKDYDDLCPDVNGGLTFGIKNVFGWDYAHFQNDMDVPKHIKNALKYFKGRMKKGDKKK